MPTLTRNTTQRGERIELFLDWLRDNILSIAGEELEEGALFDERNCSLLSLIEQELGKSFGLIVGLSLPEVEIIEGQHVRCRLTCLVTIMSNFAMAGDKDSFRLACELFGGLHATHFMEDARRMPNVVCRTLAHTRTDADVLHSFKVSVETKFC